jgi:hypothetical protein
MAHHVTPSESFFDWRNIWAAPPPAKFDPNAQYFWLSDLSKILHHRFDEPHTTTATARRAS